MTTIGIFPNAKKTDIHRVLARLITKITDYGAAVMIPVDNANELGYPELGQDLAIIKECIALGITLGGDGTLLNTAREIAPAGIPLCGVNLGQLGFLTEIELPDLDDAVERLLTGRFEIQERLMLGGIVQRGRDQIAISAALNDIVVAKGGFSRVIRLSLFINGELTAKYPADGLIVATSTGSTGYSLSAGGPIVDPNLNVILVTPICPHSLHARPMIVSDEAEVLVSFQATHDDIVLTVDGQTALQLLPDDTVKIKRAPFSAKFVRLGGSYYKKMRGKLYGDVT
ncbi:MAG: NAD(+)/NADH kinase [Negativicutes bacterium]|nr:NAD(+)/NADH kinase [Negativicutes bacterium]